jgi:hypothetical protein
MRRESLLELHYIAHFDNIISIYQEGILSHNKAESIPHDSVASEIIQDRRRSKSVPGGRHLHDYVNLYIHGRNPMLFKLKHKYGYSELCILSISPEVLNMPGVIISSCNAASDYVLFEPAPEGLDIVDEELVFARYWTHPDQVEQWRRASIKCAEVLVPDHVDAEFIAKAYVSCSDSKIMLERIMRDAGLNLNVAVNTYLFFG